MLTTPESMGFTKRRRQRAGQGRMPCGEEHRKAVCGKTACWVDEAGAGNGPKGTAPAFDPTDLEGNAVWLLASQCAFLFS